MRSRLVLAGLTAALLTSCTSGNDSSSPPPTYLPLVTTTTSIVPTTPVRATALSPEKGSVQGSGGRGMVVVLSFAAREPSVLPAEFRFGGALPAPAPTAKPGHNPAFPGLVVGLSTTGAGLGGPTANLANLFQVVSPASQLDGSMQVSTVWTNATPDFGSDVESTLVAFVVSGTAPDVIPTTQANLDVISNPIEITFRVSAGTGAAAAATAATTTTVAGGTTTSTRPTVTTTKPATVAPTATTRAATTVPATTSTTKDLLSQLLGG